MDSSTTNKTLKTLIFSAVFAALAVALNYALAFAPNIKLFNLIIFLAGFWGGINAGILAGFASSLIYFIFNPFGMSPLPLLITQVICITIVGIVGGVCKFVNCFNKKLVYIILIATIIGASLSILYNIAVDSITAMTSGVPILAYVISGIAWSGINIIINTIAFAVLIPLLLPLGKRFEKL
ncbi:MAG: hypothetical protein GY855_01740 [candidate division Zixibacteria bacterium]|nr:hypothetical protein [candidate division Zixibacteria bacterium]